MYGTELVGDKKLIDEDTALSSMVFRLEAFARHEGTWESEGRPIAPLILNSGTSLGWEVSFTPRPHYRRGKSPYCALNSWLGGPQSRCKRSDRDRNLSILPRTEPRLLGHAASNLVTILTALFRLPLQLAVLTSSHSTIIHAGAGCGYP